MIPTATPGTSSRAISSCTSVPSWVKRSSCREAVFAVFILRSCGIDSICCTYTRQHCYLRSLQKESCRTNSSLRSCVQVIICALAQHETRAAETHQRDSQQDRI